VLVYWRHHSLKYVVSVTSTLLPGNTSTGSARLREQKKAAFMPPFSVILSPLYAAFSIFLRSARLLIRGIASSTQLPEVRRAGHGIAYAHLITHRLKT
jgi:hypothetical protein